MMDDDDALTVAYLLGVTHGRDDERAKVVALLREMAINFPEGKEHRLSAIAITCAADGIERGDHLGKSK